MPLTLLDINTMPKIRIQLEANIETYKVSVFESSIIIKVHNHNMNFQLFSIIPSVCISTFIQYISIGRISASLFLSYL
ncbi:hypothetical protein J2Y60_001341 [Arcicella sp. BE140]|nr:hypothetical protein [Arcicella sp. BE51]MDR6811152.1 hypothetical protein [Arcicella sp. BE140]MDR6822502.1 hypothetical protein [Arcicella sp. BE139]